MADTEEYETALPFPVFGVTTPRSHPASRTSSVNCAFAALNLYRSLTECWRMAEELVTKAKLAESAERYDDMAKVCTVYKYSLLLS